MAGRDFDWETTLTASRCEYAYGLAVKMQHSHNQSFADTGFRAALARDKKLLRALEKLAEHTAAADEAQNGQTRRSATTEFALQRETTTTQLCREAYRLADEGNPIRNFEWIYGAAAWLAGYNL